MHGRRRVACLPGGGQGAGDEAKPDDRGFAARCGMLALPFARAGTADRAASSLTAMNITIHAILIRIQELS